MPRRRSVWLFCPCFKQDVKLNLNQSKIKHFQNMGLCPIAPPKGFPFSLVCFCHWQQQPKTPLETFGHIPFVFS